MIRGRKWPASPHPIWYPKAALDYVGQIRVDPQSPSALYRQVADSIASLIQRGVLRAGERLPATRELAGLIGLNRTTISAAYTALEDAGLITGHVGRGSFVASRVQNPSIGVQNFSAGLDWDAFLPNFEVSDPLSAQPIEISFANSRPARDGFPLEQFRRLAKQVIESERAGDILQLGSPQGYAPLRTYLLQRAVEEGVAGPNDDLMITNGCQQALDLLARSLVRTGTLVAVEDPVYHGLLKVLGRAGAELLPVAVDAEGMIPEALEELLGTHRPKLVIVTPSFQNPTGATLTLERRERILGLVRKSGSLLIENDIYSELRYSRDALPRIKNLDTGGNTVLLRSYSKIAFPGLRVGWVIAPRPLIARLVEEKQTSDLHSDQLSQAVLLRFAESGELARHLERTRQTGEARLRATLECCAEFLPRGTAWTTPKGGMSLWVELPAPLTSERLLSRAAEYGVDFLPGRYFSVRPAHARALRISFGGLSPEVIRRGMELLGKAANIELARGRRAEIYEPAAALV